MTDDKRAEVVRKALEAGASPQLVDGTASAEALANLLVLGAEHQRPRSKQFSRGEFNAQADADFILAAIRSLISQPAAPVDVVERAARALWFDFVDWQGYPNGLPTWDEMSQWDVDDRNNRCEEYRSLARAAIAALPTHDPDARAVALEKALRAIVGEYEHSREDAADIAYGMVSKARAALSNSPAGEKDNG